jgi:hypothetical protein
MTMLSNIFSCYTYYFNCSRSPLVLASFSFVLASFSFYSAIISIILSVGSYHEIEKELISFLEKYLDIYLPRLDFLQWLALVEKLKKILHYQGFAHFELRVFFCFYLYLKLFTIAHLQSSCKDGANNLHQYYPIQNNKKQIQQLNIGF